MTVQQLLRRIYNRLPVVRELRSLEETLRQVCAELEKTRTASAVALNDLQVRNDPRYADPDRLLRYSFQVCSQSGEDGIIQEIFRRIGTTDRTFVEVGIGDGSENNTAFLLSQCWTGFWIDGNHAFLTRLEARKDLPESILRRVASMVTRENIAPLFSQMGVPPEFDLLSLDIDQNTLHVWEALGAFRPRVVVVEYNGAVPPEIEWKVNYAADRVWDGTDNFGASLKAFEVLGRRMGYLLVGCEYVGANAFFVREDLVGEKFVGPFTAEHHFEPTRLSLAHRRGHYSGILDRPVTS